MRQAMHNKVGNGNETSALEAEVCNAVSEAMAKEPPCRLKIGLAWAAARRAGWRIWA